MSARLSRWLLLITVALLTTPVQADWLCDFFKSVPQDTKRRNCWPHPFVCPDYEVAQAPFAYQETNGWRRQNLLGDRLFEAKTGELTEAGRLKVRWITFEAPSQHRAIYVRSAETPEETAARLSKVQAYVAKIQPQGEAPSITQTQISDHGWSADYVETINRKYRETIPTPRLSSSNSNGSDTSNTLGN